jgi:hypothetical protein
MADLQFTERRLLERLLDMNSGYVLDFSNRTFAEFFADLGIDIELEKYLAGGSSKANRLRTFFSIESSHVVGKSLAALINIAERRPQSDSGLVAECRLIAERLSAAAPVHDLEALEALDSESTIAKLSQSIRRSLDSNEPELALDRLHTYTLKFMRAVASKHGITVERDKPLHSLVGEYIKHAKSAGLIKSIMTERILKSCISTMEAFSTVRNEESYAHDNTVLGYAESLLVCNHVLSAIRFIASIESTLAPAASTEDSEEIPF